MTTRFTPEYDNKSYDRRVTATIHCSDVHINAAREQSQKTGPKQQQLTQLTYLLDAFEPIKVEH